MYSNVELMYVDVFVWDRSNNSTTSFCLGCSACSGVVVVYVDGLYGWEPNSSTTSRCHWMVLWIW